MAIENLPEEAPHFFTLVNFEILDGVSYNKIQELSQLVKHNKKVERYKPLVDALQKIQSVRVKQIEAISIDKAFQERYAKNPDFILSDYTSQIRHIHAINELVTYGKASLDVMALFLNDFFSLNLKSQTCDFKWKENFCALIAEKSIPLAKVLDELEEWLKNDSQSCLSIISARDFWLHKGSPTIALMLPPLKAGALPIPKNLDAAVVQKEFPINEKNFVSTEEFCDTHCRNLMCLFEAILSVSVDKERESAPEFGIKYQKGKSAFFPFVATIQKEWSGIKTFL